EFADPIVRSATLDAFHKLLNVGQVVAAGMSPQACFGRIALQASTGTLFWTGFSPSAVWTTSSDGTKVYAVKVADKSGDVSCSDGAYFDASIGVAVDDKQVYWTDGGTVFRIPTASIGDPNALDPFASDPGAGLVALDDTRVYWTDDGGLAWKL